LREESERLFYLDERSSSEQDFSRVISLEREREGGREKKRERERTLV